MSEGSVMANLGRSHKADERRWTLRRSYTTGGTKAVGPSLRENAEVEVVPASQLEGAVEALRPFVQAFNDVNREFCPSFDGPLALEWFHRAARIVDGGR